ncbi:hypothetical protein AVEN_227834-1, partial [Araneus ventricosus]
MVSSSPWQYPLLNNHWAIIGIIRLRRPGMLVMVSSSAWQCPYCSNSHWAIIGLSDANWHVGDGVILLHWQYPCYPIIIWAIVELSVPNALA